MWPFKKKTPVASEADTVHADVIPFNEDVDPIFLGKTEVIPRITRDEPDTAVIPLDPVPDGPLEVDDQNLADWRAAWDEAAGLAEKIRRDTALKVLPPGLIQDVYAVTYPRTGGESIRVYHRPRGIQSALTQLRVHDKARVWEGHIAWREVTEDYVKRSA